MRVLRASAGKDSSYPRCTRKAVAGPASGSAGSAVVPALCHLQLGRLFVFAQKQQSRAQQSREQSREQSRAERGQAQAERQARSQKGRQGRRKAKQARRHRTATS